MVIIIINGVSYDNLANEFVHHISNFQPQNPLITVLNTRKDVMVSGRLLVALSDVGSNRNSNETRSIKFDGCSKITTVSEVTWIAVIRKGGKCSLKDKLHNALIGSNASAVIIIDNTIARVIDRYDFNNDIGLHLSDLAIPIHILMNESIFINAIITVNNVVLDGFISRTSVLFVSISFILLMIISLVWLTFYYIQRFRYMHAKERLSRRLANAAKKALNKIPLKTLSSEDNEVAYDFDQCAICIDNYQVGETIRILPCKHIFHKVCIDSWLIEQRSCPMCKVDILKACGIISVTSNKNSNTRPNALLEAGLISSDPETLDSSTFDVVESTMNTLSRRRGKSSFLQRYRDRYGLHHYYQGHIKNHCHKYNGHFHRKCIHHCTNHKDKFNQGVEIGVDVTSILYKTPSTNPDAERADLISESENSIASLHQIPIHSSTNKEENKVASRLTTNYEELHEISQGLICDICECNSENTPIDCDICGSAPNQSTSTSCSCESCDCYFIERENRHFDGTRNNSAAGIGNLLGCCVSSGIDRQRPNNRFVHDRSTPALCCYNPCSHCRNRSLGNSHVENEFVKSHQTYKQCSSKSRCVMSIAHSHSPMPIQLTDNLMNLNQFAQIPNTKPYLSRIGSRKKDYDNLKQLKSIQLTKNSNKCTTIDSYTKSSLSDEFDYEADGGSSSLEIAVPAVKLTVLPPQVQYHQGSPNSDSSHSSSKTAEVNILDGFQRYDEYQESENSKSDSIIQNSPDPPLQC